MNRDKKIILDADVIIHFFKGGCLEILPSIFPNDYIICDLLLEHEILPGPLNDLLQSLIESGAISVVELELHENNIEILIEYSNLTKRFGKGESACMAFCKYSNDVIGSSNLKDITEYCINNGIQYLTTMDFLYTAYKKELLTEEQCKVFVEKNIKQKSRLPYKTFKEFLESL